MSAKQEILARIARAGHIVPSAIPREYFRAAADHDVVAQMEEALIDYTATVTHADEQGIPAAIAQALSDVPSVVVPPGLPEEWRGNTTIQKPFTESAVRDALLKALTI